MEAFVRPPAVDDARFQRAWGPSRISDAQVTSNPDFMRLTLADPKDFNRIMTSTGSLSAAQKRAGNQPILLSYADPTKIAQEGEQAIINPKAVLQGTPNGSKLVSLQK